MNFVLVVECTYRNRFVGYSADSRYTVESTLSIYSISSYVLKELTRVQYTDKNGEERRMIG